MTGASPSPVQVLFESYSFVSDILSTIGTHSSSKSQYGRLDPTISPGNFSIKKIKKKSGSGCTPVLPALRGTRQAEA